MPYAKSSKAHQENRSASGKKATQRKRMNKNVPAPAAIESGDEDGDAPVVSVADLRLPDVTVLKLMKEALPKNVVIAQDVKDAMRRIPTIFGLFLTDHALQVTHAAKRRTLLPEDVVAALASNGFSTFCDKVMPVVEKRRANFRSNKKPKQEEEEMESAPTGGATSVPEPVANTDNAKGEEAEDEEEPTSLSANLYPGLPAGPFSHSLLVHDDTGEASVHYHENPFDGESDSDAERESSRSSNDEVEGNYTTAKG
ncbi:hypothetical protein BV898_09130 [Hypsibius exemplaris]|uniref:DNA polymerase epsilon subunit 3 n=1 Tax=Hypsibius exemplaris TaxID=2072580 RepID=A0A1W0WNI4_HYPEX|nr:hypothetical protein BV898_09130 [Hypsibius exemplaris]